MSNPATPFQAYSAVAQQLIDKASQLWVEAGEQSDSKEGLGIDGRIALVHNLIDLWMTSWATLVECVVKLPGALPKTSQASEPLPSEFIEVKSADHVRQLEADGPFVRVGMPKVAIPASAIGFKPPFLPAGVTQFQLVLKDYRYVGANYTGKVKLTTQAVANVAPEEKVVTVGL